jgi:AGZA family xanthine/uracil permease-like MFS transporter
MGLLLTFIGLQTAKIVVPDAETMVTLGDLTAFEPVLAIVGLALISSLHYRNVKGSIILGIFAIAIAFFAFRDTWPTKFVALPHLKVFHMDFSQLIGKGATTNAWGAVLAYVLVMTFDIGGALFGLGNLAGLVKEGLVPGATVAYVAAALGTALGAVTGTTPLIIAAESAVGIKEGGRTGLVAITISMCFLISMFLAPFLQAIPAVATAPVLVLVGAMMMGESVHIDWSTMVTAVPAFLTIVIQPFTFSIANGIYAGLVMSLLLFFMTGNFIDYFKELFTRGPGHLEDEATMPFLVSGDTGDEEAVQNGNGTSEVREGLPVPAHRRSSKASMVIGSLERRHPYERGSFTMYINTFGSHQSPGGGLLTGTGSYQGQQPGTPTRGYDAEQQ